MRRPPPGRAEFVALVAVLFATVAFSIDAMLPALPEIAARLSPGAPNTAQLVITSFLFGMGAGTFLAGPISDTVGRKPAILFGLALYAVGAVMASLAQSLETMLAARVLQGLGAAFPRIVSQALIRDRFMGREMAQITSFVMMIFILIPAIGPAIGQVIIDLAGWRAIFAAFVLFGFTGGAWLALRQPETLPTEARRPFRAGLIALAVRETLSHAQVRICIAVITLGMGQMFALISSVHQVYDVFLDRADSFAWWFMVTALLAGTGTIVNAALVMRLGMRRLAVVAYGMQAVISALLIALAAAGMIPEALRFVTFFGWSVSVFFMVGLTFGNLNALALEPLGHIAGTAASVIGAISTVLAVTVAVPIGLAFDGTPQPLYAGTALCSALAFMLMRRTVERQPA